MRQIADYYPLLRAAIAEAKTAGLEPAATELEGKAFAAYTTSTELLGEHGLAIKAFLKSCGAATPAAVKAKLDQCLAEIRKAHPRI